MAQGEFITLLPMKKLLLTLLIALPALAQAQSYGLPTDSTTHKVIYEGVIQTPGATQAELYSRAREWFATSFNSGKDVLDMDDRQSGKLIGKAYADFALRVPMIGSVTQKMWRVVKVYVKDGRYRYEITDFAAQGYYRPGQVPESTQTAMHPVEEFFDTKNSMFFDKRGTPKPMAQSVFDATQAQAKAQIASLQNAMVSPTAKKEKDW